MLVAVVLASLAGFGRDRQLKKLQQTSGSFLVGLIMTVIAGVTSAGLWLAFIYCRRARFSRASAWSKPATKIELNVSGAKDLASRRFAKSSRSARTARSSLKDGEAAETEKASESQEKRRPRRSPTALSGKYPVADGRHDRA